MDASTPVPTDASTVGYRAFGRQVLSGVIAERIVHFTAVVNSASPNWWSNYATVTVPAVTSHRILDGLQWSVKNCPGQYLVVVSKVPWNPNNASEASALAASAIVPTELHGNGESSGIVMEPIDMRDIGILYVHFIPVKWSAGASATFDVNVVFADLGWGDALVSRPNDIQTLFV
jgi:hypothetical protein